MFLDRYYIVLIQELEIIVILQSYMLNLFDFFFQLKLIK